MERYLRHLALAEVGPGGQQRLGTGSVLVVGAGGLGSPAALYLAAAGVGRIGLVDFDAVDLTNLQRQVLYRTADVGRPKLEAACERLIGLNPEVRIEPHPLRLDRENAAAILARYDVVLDGSDNFPTRFLVNDLAVRLGKPNVYGSVFRFEGQVSVFAPGGPCYRCLYPQPPPPGAVPSCAEGGVLGVLPGVIGALQATEALKLLLGRGEPLVGRLLHFDALALRFREVRLRRDPGCAGCGEGTGAAPPGRASRPTLEIEVEQLRSRLESANPPLLVDVRTDEERAICRLDGARCIPLPELPRRLDELDRSREIVVFCHSGVRSLAAVEFLLGQGFRTVANLAGGIDAWAARIDRSMPRY